MWGAKGVMTTHGFYEFGVATIIAPLRLKKAYPTQAECDRVLEIGTVEMFKQAADDIYSLGMYERFVRHGWTRELARETRDFLAPTIAKTITLAWYESLMRAEGK
jgi:hypothetical protein